MGRFTSPVAVLEAVMGLARPDRFNLASAAVAPIVLEFLEARDIDIRDLPPARQAVDLATQAADRYGAGRHLAPLLRRPVGALGPEWKFRG